MLSNGEVNDVEVKFRLIYFNQSKIRIDKSEVWGGRYGSGKLKVKREG